MRILFSAVPAYGHALPLVPLMQAAVGLGHSVGMLTSAGFRADLGEELPVEVELLEAGAMPGDFSEDAARRTGADVFHPTPPVIGEIFGGSRVDLAIDESIERTAAWGAELIIAEPFDAVGPIVAARLGIDWHQAGIGPAVPAVIGDEIHRVALARYERLGLEPVAVSSYIDPCPPLLQDPDWSPTTAVRPVRPQAHRRSKDADLELSGPNDKPTVLVTLGTIFSDPDTLAATVAAVADAGVNVIATIGSSLRHPTEGQTFSEPDSARVQYVPFVPLAQLLDRVDLVVGAGGVGTVLGTLVHGLPMVLWPQGADQPINAARAASSGVAVIADSADEIAGAVAVVLGNGAYRERAQAIADEIAVRPDPATVIAEITNPWP
ncbi:glycosyltransferase [Promicromonospora sp. NPDC019610]|uniref:glycosyltransferase n=1 Tax=Promicromonospora sp. NPDC019610 TaxID=3364405 RepID=UPI00379C4498